MFPEDLGTVVILGDTFLKAHYTHYDMKNLRIGIANPFNNHPTDSSDSSQTSESSHSGQFNPTSSNA